MKLDVLADTSAKQPWYRDGLNFTCTQCGNCCTGGPGYVWLTTDEIVRLAEHLNLTPEETVERYCRKFDGRFSLGEVRRNGQYDCIFLREEPVTVERDGRQVTEVHRKCAVYPVRPLQCRTWPFWPENLRTREAWDRAGVRCHGINHGRHFTPAQIHAVRDAADWPADPPSSK